MKLRHLDEILRECPSRIFSVFQYEQFCEDLQAWYDGECETVFDDNDAMDIEIEQLRHWVPSEDVGSAADALLWAIDKHLRFD